MRSPVSRGERPFLARSNPRTCQEHLKCRISVTRSGPSFESDLKIGSNRIRLRSCHLRYCHLNYCHSMIFACDPSRRVCPVNRVSDCVYVTSLTACRVLMNFAFFPSGLQRLVRHSSGQFQAMKSGSGAPKIAGLFRIGDHMAIAKVAGSPLQKISRYRVPNSGCDAISG